MLFSAVKYSLIFFLFISAPHVCAQDFSAVKKQGEEHFSNKKYLAALNSFLSLSENEKTSGDMLTKIGACYFELGELEKAKENLEAAAQSNFPTPGTWRYLAKVHHERFEFEEAIRYYKIFLRAAEEDAPLRAAVKDDLIRCGNGIRVRRKESTSAVVNLGPPINSADDEFRPILYPKEKKRIFFAKIRSDEAPEMGSDLFFSDLTQGDWQAPRPLSIFLNTTEHEVPMGFNEKGNQIYFFRGPTSFSGEIYWDTLRETNVNGTLFIPTFESPVRAWEGDRDLFFFSDSVLLFSSRRPGGYGGFDLYATSLKKDGWSAAENLGPTINSAYDEVSPFLAKDGRTLYFSSNDSQRSIGGMDILRSFFLDRTSAWIPAENLGLGINSAGDDEHFSLSPDGSQALFSSSRKQGFGRRDLYVGLFEKSKREQFQHSEPLTFLHVLPPEKEGTSPPAPISFPSGESALTLMPLRYPQPNMPLTEASFETLNELVGWMKKVPELKVSFVAHTALGDNRKICEPAFQQVREFLQRENISLQNISFRTAGSVFTLSDATAAENRRIDLILANPETLPVKVKKTVLESSRAAFFQKAAERLVYQIKIPLGERLSADTILQDYPDGNLLEYPVSNESVFVRGIFLTWNSAFLEQKEMNKSGYPTARAIPFFRGWELSRAEAENLLESFPDLVGFLNQ